MPRQGIDYGLIADGGASFTNTALTTGATQTADINCAGYTGLTIFARLRGTNTTADLTVTVQPYLPDNVTLHGAVLPVISSTATVVVGADIQTVLQYLLRGTQRARILLKNNNAGTLNFDLAYLLGE